MSELYWGKGASLSTLTGSWVACLLQTRLPFSEIIPTCRWCDACSLDQPEPSQTSKSHFFCVASSTSHPLKSQKIHFSLKLIVEGCVRDVQAQSALPLSVTRLHSYQSPAAITVPRVNKLHPITTPSCGFRLTNQQRHVPAERRSYQLSYDGVSVEAGAFHRRKSRTHSIIFATVAHAT